MSGRAPGWPEEARLSREHLAELQASGISPEAAVERGYQTVYRDSPNDLRNVTRLRGLGVPGWALEPTSFPGLLIPQYDVHGQTWGHIWKPRRPVPGDDGKLRKYAFPRSTGQRIDVPRRCSNAILDPTVPIWITEGSKKADALASAGQVAFSVNGITGWTHDGGIPVGDLQSVQWRGREVRIAFDADMPDKPLVKQQAQKLADHLLARGAAEVRMICLPTERNGQPAKGVDDHLAAGATVDQLVEVGYSHNPNGISEWDVELEYRRQRVRELAQRRLREEGQETQDQRLARLEAATLSSADLDDLPPPEWLVQDWLPMGGLCQLTGASGSYKTFVGVGMAVRVALGLPWFGYEVKAGPVVYVAAEGGRALRQRIREAEAALNSGVPAAELFVHPAAVQMLGADWSALVEVCRRRKAVLVVVDTLARSSVGVEENSATETGRLVQAAADLTDATGATVLLVHHAGHGSTRGRGSSAVYAAMDAVVFANRTADMRLSLSTRQVDGGKAKDAEEQAANLKLTQGPLGVSLIVANLDGSDAQDRSLTARGAVLAVVRHFVQVVEEGKSVHGLTQAEVLRAAKRGSPGLVREVVGEGFPETTVKRAFRELVKDEVLVSVNSTQRYVLPAEGGPK